MPHFVAARIGRRVGVKRASARRFAMRWADAPGGDVMDTADDKCPNHHDGHGPGLGLEQAHQALVARKKPRHSAHTPRIDAE